MTEPRSDRAAEPQAVSERGVEFVQEPTERPCGIETVFRDGSGNWYRLTQRHA